MNFLSKNEQKIEEENKQNPGIKVNSDQEQKQIIKTFQSAWFKSPQLTTNLLSKVGHIGSLDLKGDKEKAFILGISGGSSAGKTLLSQLIKAKLKEHAQQEKQSEPFIPIIKQSDFYKTIPEAPQGVDPEKFQAEYKQSINYDTPSSIDWDYMIKCLNILQKRTPVDMPQYNMEQEQREKKTYKIKQKADIIILEGTLLFQNETIRNMCNLKIFLDTDEDIRLSRRVYKDCCLRKKTLPEVIEKYRKFTKDAFEKYTFPSKKYADMVIPNFGGDYSATSFAEEQSAAGFSSIANGVLYLVLNLLGNRINNKDSRIVEEVHSSENSPFVQTIKSPGVAKFMDSIQI